MKGGSEHKVVYHSPQEASSRGSLLKYEGKPPFQPSLRHSRHCVHSVHGRENGLPLPLAYGRSQQFPLI